MTNLPVARPPEPDGPVRLRWFHQRWLPFIVAAAGFAMSLLLWRTLWREERLNLERTLTAEARLLNEELIARMEPRVVSLVRMAERWGPRLDTPPPPIPAGSDRTDPAASGSAQRQDWEVEAALNFNHFLGYEAFFLVTPDGRFRWRVPPLQGVASRAPHLEAAALEAARERRTPRLSGPMGLPSGERGFHVYVPLYRDDGFAGWIAGAFQYQAVFDAILKDLAAGYDVEIAHEGETVYRQRAEGESAEETAPGGMAARRRIELYGSPIVIRVRPGPAVIAGVESALPQVALLGALFLSFLFALALLLAQKADRRSRFLAAERRRLERSEAELARARDYYLTLLEHFPALIWRTSSNAWCDYHNQTWLDFTGRRFDEEQGSGRADGVHPDDRDRLMQKFTAAFEARAPFEMEYRLRHHSGEYRRVSDHARPIYDLAGGFAGYLGACFDLTQREKALAALRESEEVFRTIVETSAVGVARTDPYGHFIQTNEAYRRMLGYSEEEMRGLTMEEITHPEDWPRNREHFERLIGREIPSFNIEKRYLRKDGNEIWVLNSVSAVFDASGRPVFVHAISQDITEEKRIRGELEKREFLLREAQEIAGMGSWDWDLRSDGVAWSDTEYRLFGLVPGSVDLTYANFLGLVHPEDRPLVEEAVRRTMEEGACETIFRILRSDGSTRWLQSRRYLVRDEAGKPLRMIGTSHDITEAKEAEEALHILAEAGIAFGRSLDYRQTLGEVAKLAVPALADFCFFDMQAEDGHIERFVLLHRDPSKQGLLENAVSFVPTPELDAHPLMKTLRSGEPELVTDADDAWRDRIAMNAEHAELIRALGVRSVLTVPVPGQNRVLGALSFFRTGDSGRRFDRRELPLFEELARRAGVALENARLHDELRNREAQLAEAQAIAHIGRWDRDLRTDRAYWTDETYRIFGLEPQSEITTAGLVERLHPDDEERARRIVRESRRTGAPFVLEARIVRPDGAVRVIHARGQSRTDAGGRVVHQFGICQDVTELRQVEEALRASEEKYRILAEHSADLITQQTPDGEILYVSPAVETMVGYTPEEMVGRNGREFIFPADLDRIESLRLALLHGEPSVTVVFRMRMKGGGYRWVEATGRAVPEPGSSRFASVISVVRDITQAIIATERDRLLQAITVVANEAEAAGPALHLVLDKICEHTGSPAGHVAITDRRTGGIGSIDIWHLPESERLDSFRATIRQIPALAGNALPDRVLASGQGEWIEDLASDSQRIRSAFAVPIRSGDRTLAVLEFFSPEPRPRDELLIEVLHESGVQLGEMIRRLRAEAALGASEMRFRALSESAHDAIFTLDANGVIQYCNASCGRIFGYESDDILGRPFTALLSDRTAEQRSEAHVFGQLMKARDPSLIGRTVELAGRRQDGGEVPIELALSWWEAEEGVYFTVILRDITARKEMAAMLEEKMTDLARSNAELALFTYIASHDLREPLRTVASNVQVLERRFGEAVDPEAREEMGYAVAGVKRMQALIDDLLAHSRVGTEGKALAPVEAGEALDDALQALQVAIAESGGVVTRDLLPRVFADRGQIAQLFQNLISNAMRFNASDRPRVHVSAERAGSEWILSVDDNGIGIAPEHAERVFLPFQRLHAAEEYPGTGMGLAICRRIVERHGGRIWVDSRPGTGSVFRFAIRGADEPNAFAPLH